MGSVSITPRRARACLALIVLALAPAAKAESDRVFSPRPGYTLAKDLPPDFRGVADSVELDIRDAFDGSTAHNAYDSLLFDVGNALHIESRPSTIRRRLLFARGDTVTRDRLLETERALRGEEFIADALVQVKVADSSGPVPRLALAVTTYDHWSISVGGSVSRLGKAWIYSLGALESNLLGTGQRVGVFYGHDPYRDSYSATYRNDALFYPGLQLNGLLSKLSDGHDYQGTLAKPLLTRQDRYAFSASGTSRDWSERYYFDANRFPDLDRAEGAAGAADSLNRRAANVLAIYPHAITQTAALSATRSYGLTNKFNLSGTFDLEDRHQDPVLTDTGSFGYGVPSSVPAIASRRDYLAGVSLSFYRYSYKTMRNLRRLKWNEDLDVGFRLTGKFARNLDFLGADNGDYYLSQTAVYNDAWSDRQLFNSSLTTAYFLTPDGDFRHGSLTASGEYFWKPVPVAGTYLAASWSQLFAEDPSQQLTLGEDEGLNGYPNVYFAGRARFLAEAEQRFFPPFELLTLVPAFALFLDAGNTFSAADRFDPHDLHYSAGIGLRLGLSKSTQRIVNHFNITWPVDDPYLKGFQFSIKAKQSL